jgi:hypothetical protein
MLVIIVVWLKSMKVCIVSEKKNTIRKKKHVWNTETAFFTYERSQPCASAVGTPRLGWIDRMDVGYRL